MMQQCMLNSLNNDAVIRADILNFEQIIINLNMTEMFEKKNLKDVHNKFEEKNNSFSYNIYF